MRDRLFTIIDGEPVVTAPLVNLKSFKKLWETDKTEDKSIYKKWMLYIYYMYDYRSEFFEEKDKESKILKEVFGKTDVRIPKRLTPCIDDYISRNTPAEQRTLQAAINSADNIADNLSKLQQNVSQLDNVIEALEKQVDKSLKEGDVLVCVELTKEKLKIQESQMTLINKSADLIPKIERNVESIINLRDKVEKSMNKISDSGENLESYIIDDFLTKKELGVYNQ
jgi:hypothetical protein